MMKFRFYKLIFYFFLLYPIINFGQNTKPKAYAEKLAACLNNPTFQSDFSICREADSVFVNTAIYNNTKHAFHSYAIKTNCKTLEIVDDSQIDIEKDAQRIRGECKRGKIVLLSFEIKNNTSKFRFINTCNNSYLELEVNKQNKSKIIGRGSF